MSSYLAHKRKGFQGAAPLAFDGFGNRSRSFNGVDDYIDIPDNADIPTGAQTWACWAKFDDNNTFRDLMLHWEGSTGNASFGLVRNTDNKLRIYVDPDGLSNTPNTFVAGSTSLVKGNWYHVAGVFVPSTSMTVYVNGSADGQSTSQIPTQAFNATVPLTLGGRTDQPSFLFNGNIADCRIYDAELTATQISDLYNGTNITTNLVGHWLTDADDTEDKAGSNNGTNYGSKYSYDNPSPPVEFGRASRSFDGTNDYIDLGNNYGSSVFTASAWIKRDTIIPTAVGIVGKWKTANDKSWLLYSGIEHKCIIRQSNNTTIICTDPTNAVANQWYHLAATADGSNLKLYVDGSLVDTQSYDGTMSANSLSTDIGTFRQSDGNFWFDGKIADVRIYNTHLTASQISDLYAGKDVQTNLVGHYLTNNDDVEDKAGANDGTNFGSLYDYDAPFTEVTLPNHFWNLSDTGTYADSGKLASAGWDLNEFSSVSSSVQSIGTSTKTVLDTISGGVLEYKNGANVDVGWDSESKEISMACWFYCDSISSSGNWFISWRGNNTDNKIAQLFVRNDGGLQILRGTIWDAQGDSALTPQSGTSISLNTWYHGALTWDNTTLKVYIDGELFASATNASVDGFGTNVSGCNFAVANASWDKNSLTTRHLGYTFGAGVWDVALTENQIKALYNDGNALDYSDTTWR